MTNEERLNTLNQAVELIRSVEFSYAYGSEERRKLYKFVVDNFSLTGDFVRLRQELQEKAKDERYE